MERGILRKYVDFLLGPRDAGVEQLPRHDGRSYSGEDQSDRVIFRALALMHGHSKAHLVTRQLRERAIAGLKSGMSVDQIKATADAISSSPDSSQGGAPPAAPKRLRFNPETGELE